MSTLAIVGVPSAYRLGLASAAAERGWQAGVDGEADVVVAPLRTEADCSALDREAAGGGTVVALVSPYEREEIAHAIRHGAFPADWDWDPDRILAAAEAAARGDLLLPLETARSLAPPADVHRPDPVIGEEEAAWLIALSRGATVVRLADDAGYSERAMFRRLADLYARLGARGRTEALLTAERLGLLGGPD